VKLPYDSQDAIQVLSNADEQMGALIHAAGPFEIDFRPAQDPFEALCQAIVHQQLSGKAAGTIYGRFMDLLSPADHPVPHEVLSLAPEDMRGAGLSGAKTEAILDLAAKTIEGVVPDGESLRTMSDEEIVERLTSVRGIGPWTVDMLLIFRLGRPDVLPSTDLGIRKGFARVYGLDDLPAASFLDEHGDLWRPYRSVASWYLWRALELEDEGIVLLP